MQCLLSFWPLILKQIVLMKILIHFAFLVVFPPFLPEEAKACNRVMDLGVSPVDF